MYHKLMVLLRLSIAPFLLLLLLSACAAPPTISLQDTIVRIDGRTRGTGFYVDDRGTVLTALHLVDPDSTVTVTNHAGPQLYRVSCIPEHQELAYLSPIEVDGTTKFLRSSRRRYQVGDPVVVIGYPDLRLGYGGANKSEPFVVVSAGIVSGTTNTPLFELRGVASSTRYILSDVTTVPGHSGSPLLNSVGEVVGIFQGWRFATTNTVAGGIEYTSPIGFSFATDVTDDAFKCETE